MNEEQYKEIESYLSGKLSPEKTTQFEKRIENDKELAENVSLLTSINLHLINKSFLDEYNLSNNKAISNFIVSEEATELKQDLFNVNEKYQEDQVVSNGKTSKDRLIYFLISTAALLIFALFAFNLFTKDSAQDLYASYYQLKDLPSFTKRSTDNESLSEATKLFKIGRYDESLQLFDGYVFATDTENINGLVFIYKALIYSEQGKLKKAIQQLNILEDSKSIDSGRALWYKSLIHLKFDKKEDAKRLLRKLLANPQNYKFKEAQDLFSKI